MLVQLIDVDIYGDYYCGNVKRKARGAGFCKFTIHDSKIFPVGHMVV
jgi:hypothetical protein